MNPAMPANEDERLHQNSDSENDQSQADDNDTDAEVVSELSSLTSYETRSLNTSHGNLLLFRPGHTTGSGRILVPGYQESFLDEFALPQPPSVASSGNGSSRFSSVPRTPPPNKSLTGTDSSSNSNSPPLPAQVLLVPSRDQALAVVGLARGRYRGTDANTSTGSSSGGAWRRACAPLGFCLIPAWFRRAPRRVRLAVWGSLACLLVATAILVGTSVARRNQADDGVASQAADTTTDWRNTVGTLSGPTVAPTTAAPVPTISPRPSSRPSRSAAPSMLPSASPRPSVRPSRSAVPTESSSRRGMGMGQGGMGRMGNDDNEEESEDDEEEQEEETAGGEGEEDQDPPRGGMMMGVDTRLVASATSFPTFSPPRQRARG